ncbi:MAG: DUF3352 domain-containing protein [Cyanobacteria bacterium P01_D01_bin.14]
MVVQLGRAGKYGLGAFFAALIGLALFFLRPAANLPPVQAAMPTATAFVPQQSILTATLLISPDDLPPALQSSAPWQSFQSALRQETGLDYAQDIRPWLGHELLVAVTPGIAAEPNGYLVVLAVTDSDRARECLELFWQRQTLTGTALALETVSGARMIRPQRSERQWSTALVGNRYLLFANRPTVLRQGLQALQSPGLNLAHQSAYQTALTALPAERIGLVHLNIPAAVAALGLGSPKADSPPQFSDGTISIDLDRQGIVLHTALLADPRQPLPAASPTPPTSSVSAYLPASVAIAAIGHNLTALWQQLMAEGSHYRDLPQPLQRLGQALATPEGKTGNRALQTLLTGDYAIGWAPTGDWILAAEQSPRSTTTLATLDQLAARQALNVTPLTVQQQPVIAWTQLKTQTALTDHQRETSVETQVRALHTHQDIYDVGATAIGALAEALDPQVQTLVSRADYQQALRGFDQPNDGYLYLNWQILRTASPLRIPLFDLLKTTAQPLLDRLQSLTLSSYGRQPEYTKADIRIRFTSY